MSQSQPWQNFQMGWIDLCNITIYKNYNNFKDSSVEVKFDRQLVLFVMDKIKSYETKRKETINYFM